VPQLNTLWLTVGFYEKVGHGDTPGDDCTVCSAVTGVRGQSTRHHETLKTIPRIFGGQLIAARTKFKLGLE